MKKLLLLALTLVVFTGCKTNQDDRDRATANQQQSQYGKAQPIPLFDHSLERDQVIKLYHLRNEKVSTHTVWRSDYGTVEGECTSLGYGIPYDTSLTNPWKLDYISNHGTGAIGQAEPNGVYASTNTAATWVMCLGTAGNIEPIYVESKVTTYPYPVKVNWDKNRVTKSGKATATIRFK